MPEQLPLRDVIAHLPGWWPPALLWWFLALLAGFIAWITLRWVLRKVRGEYYGLKKSALLVLDRLKVQGDLNDQQLSAEVSGLLKRVARRRFQDKNIAHLSGKKWLTFLDDAVIATNFSDEGGEALLDAQYRPSVKINRDALIQAAREWVNGI